MYPCESRGGSAVVKMLSIALMQGLSLPSYRELARYEYSHSDSKQNCAIGARAVMFDARKPGTIGIFGGFASKDSNS